MKRRYSELKSNLPHLKFSPFLAIKIKIKEGYTGSDLKDDLMAGLIVALVAIPLGMALAIASGAPPESGLYTVIIGGGLVALLGGSRFQVTGPTAAFVVILAPIVGKFGLGGLLFAGMLAGILLVVMGLLKLGQFIQFIPYPVTTGFTSGIAVVIATIQLKDFFGLKVAQMPDHYFGRIQALWDARNTFAPTELGVGLTTLFILLLWPKINKKIPAPILALGSVTIGTFLLSKYFPDISISTIGNRFHFHTFNGEGNGIPQTLPVINLPWNFKDPSGYSFSFNFESIRLLMPSAFAIAMLGAIESLLSAVVADGMAKTKHDPDSELMALGIGNIICPFFGGIAATGAIARTATNIRFGAKSPFASIFHAIFTLFAILVFAPYVSYLPMAAMAALLILVAYNMSEIKHFGHILKAAPLSDVWVLLICFGLTVAFDMVTGVSVGVMLAALLFMKRMANLTSVKLTSGGSSVSSAVSIPPEIVVYKIEGPLFFGAAEKASQVLTQITDDIKAVIFDLSDVPVLDVTGLVALESAINKICTKKRNVFLVGIRAQPQTLIDRSDILRDHRIGTSRSISEAVDQARHLMVSFQAVEAD